MTETKKIQEQIRNLLAQKMRGRDVDVISEWNPTKEATDGYDNKVQYAPKTDVAAGPFMIHYIGFEEKEKIDNAFDANKKLIEKIKEEGETFENFGYNNNPRCLIAIEIETSGSRKHLIGDITNASILGKVGLIVPTDEANYKAFKRIMKYLNFAQKNDKTSKDLFKNIILIKHKNLIDLLRSYNS